MVLMVNSYISILLLLFAFFVYICVSFAGTRDGANFPIFTLSLSFFQYLFAKFIHSIFLLLIIFFI